MHVLARLHEPQQEHNVGEVPTATICTIVNVASVVCMHVLTLSVLSLLPLTKSLESEDQAIWNVLRVNKGAALRVMTRVM